MNRNQYPPASSAGTLDANAHQPRTVGNESDLRGSPPQRYREYSGIG